MIRVQGLFVPPDGLMELVDIPHDQHDQAEDRLMPTIQRWLDKSSVDGALLGPSVIAYVAAQAPGQLGAPNRRAHQFAVAAWPRFIGLLGGPVMFLGVNLEGNITDVPDLLVEISGLATPVTAQLAH
jgi:hypothetical protein